MKKILLPILAVTASLGACAQEAEDQVEDAYEERADALEEKADEVMENAEDRVDALDDKADRMDAMSDKMGDRVEDGVLDKSEAMPANVVDNDGNRIEEAVQ